MRKKMENHLSEIHGIRWKDDRRMIYSDCRRKNAEKNYVRHRSDLRREFWWPFEEIDECQ